MPILVAPLAGLLSDRIGSRPLLVSGMALMAGALAWIASVASPTVANVVLSAVRRDQEGKASGVNNTVREVGGVFGVAVLASVFASVGGYASPGAFAAGLDAALWVGAAAVGLGTIAAFGIPGRKAVISGAAALQLASAQE